MSITLEKIAHLTGTSPATVSRAIRGSTRISEKTRERIVAVAEQFNYRPNLVARSMVSRTTQLIGMVLPMSASGPFSRIIGGIEHAARVAGYSVVFCQTEDDEQILSEHLKLLGGRRVDGVLICSHSDSHFSLSCLDQFGPKETRPPIVFVQEPFGQNEYPSVTVDNLNGAKQLGQHLIEHGHRDIGYIGMGPHQTGQLRYDGYRAAMKQAGQDPNRVQHVEAQLRPGPSSDDPSGFVDSQWMRDTLEAHPNWTVLAVESDILAIKVIQALKAIGKRVPQDIAVVGFDDVLVSAFVDPPLTTMRQPSTEIGKVACNLLLDQIAGKVSDEKLVSIRIPCTLQVRSSCGCSLAS